MTAAAAASEGLLPMILANINGSIFVKTCAKCKIRCEHHVGRYSLLVPPTLWYHMVCTQCGERFTYNMVPVEVVDLDKVKIN
jgi:hypothetical protein